MDRGIYDIAVLADPASAWNHKLVLPFGQSTAPYHKQSTPTTVLDHNAALARVHGREQLAEHPGQEREQRRQRRGRDDAEGAHPRGVRLDPLHDRPGLLGREHRPARGREHLPGPARRHHAAVQLPRHLDDRERGDRLRAAAALLGDGLAAALGRLQQRAFVSGHQTAVELQRLGARLRLRPVGEPVAVEHDHRLRRARKTRSTTPVTNPDGVRCDLPTTRSRSGARARRTASPSGRATTSASSTASTRCRAGRSRPSSSST